MISFQMKEVQPYVDSSVRILCTRPYPNHRKGCPNFGKKLICPPQCKLLGDLLDLDQQVFAIYAEFDLGQHVKNMYERHPNWTYRQTSCCLYWQGSVRSKLNKYAEELMKKHPGTTIITCPEGAGVNVTETMRKAGVKLEWPPKNTTRMIYLLGRPR
ncbi:hypothetical protein LCGC14_0873440 [marine sediment metagenome]|uniref:DUF2284 domain-containing protein n=1 Tax=marine sediment metagenome TaxID=412755 RepID=A0A0F9RNN9_9ZZZZ